MKELKIKDYDVGANFVKLSNEERLRDVTARLKWFHSPNDPYRRVGEGVLIGGMHITKMALESIVENESNR